ncbi:hypothetical protein [Phytohabitans aurantiacus]|jgi:hypothetical protein|uniref:Secreted protein n=1 Tax=Phytohabitans aurantiacus TaxID=3016789 RepID=A0ABQ5R7X8_9ACTN|nr:hypothetical protein [Phytohabitans aurantiacus]GLI02485.1 hypothetical protein Pa4123_77630 [Phytohabitans aurantiacus]
MMRALGAAVGVAVLMVVGVIVAPAASAATALTASNFRLQASAYSSLIDDLDAALPNVSVPAVLADANREAEACAPTVSNRVASFCWDPGDNGVTYWYPQGITTTADALGAGTYEGATAILVSWYDDGTSGIERGVRVSFVDYSTPSAPVYRHVLLVEPYTRTDGKASFRAVNVHAGGIFWYGHYLYVASTSQGFRVFDMRHLWQTSTANGAAIGLQSDGTYQAFGYKYVLPQALTYTRSTAGGYAALRFSFASLDRTSTPDSVIVGEWDGGGAGTRLVRFPIDASTRMLTASSDGLVRGSQAYDMSIASMQGGTAIRGKYYLSVSDSDTGRGEVKTYTPGGSVTTYTNHLPIGPEDVSYWEARDQLWSLTEYPNTRSIYAIRASAY